MYFWISNVIIIIIIIIIIKFTTVCQCFSTERLNLYSSISGVSKVQWLTTCGPHQRSSTSVPEQSRAAGRPSHSGPAQTAPWPRSEAASPGRLIRLLMSTAVWPQHCMLGLTQLQSITESQSAQLGGRTKLPESRSSWTYLVVYCNVK